MNGRPENFGIELTEEQKNVLRDAVVSIYPHDHSLVWRAFPGMGLRGIIGDEVDEWLPEARMWQQGRDGFINFKKEYVDNWKPSGGGFPEFALNLKYYFNRRRDEVAELFEQTDVEDYYRGTLERISRLGFFVYSDYTHHTFHKFGYALLYCLLFDSERTRPLIRPLELEHMENNIGRYFTGEKRFLTEARLRMAVAAKLVTQGKFNLSDVPVELLSDADDYLEDYLEKIQRKPSLYHHALFNLAFNKKMLVSDLERK